MIQTFKENPRPNFASQILGDVGRGIGSFGNEFLNQKLMQHKESKENESLKSLLGQDFSGINPEMKKLFVEQMLKSKGEQEKIATMSQYGMGRHGSSSSSHSQPNLGMAEGALNTLEDLVGQSGIGFLGSGNYSSDARRNRGLFESTQAALMPLFKSMFPRGMTEKEFKFVQENYIPQPGDTEAKIKGKIQGLRKLVQDQNPGESSSRGGSLTPSQMGPSESTPRSERRPLSSFGG